MSRCIFHLSIELGSSSRRWMSWEKLQFRWDGRDLCYLQCRLVALAATSAVWKRGEGRQESHRGQSRTYCLRYGTQRHRRLSSGGASGAAIRSEMSITQFNCFFWKYVRPFQETYNWLWWGKITNHRQRLLYQLREESARLMDRMNEFANMVRKRAEVEDEKIGFDQCLIKQNNGIVWKKKRHNFWRRTRIEAGWKRSRVKDGSSTLIFSLNFYHQPAVLRFDIESVQGIEHWAK